MKTSYGRTASTASIAAMAALLGACEKPAAVHESTLSRYCFDCHNDVERVADLSLERLDVSAVDAAPAHWENVVRKLRAGVMPPADAPRPDAETRLELAAWLERELDAAAAASPDPGRTVAFHRLKRDIERELIQRSLERSGGNKGRAARLLNLKRTTLVEKLKRLHK